MTSSEPTLIPPHTCPVDYNALLPSLGCPVSQRAADFDPFEGDYQVDPAASLRWSREEEPIFYTPSLGYWVVTRYQDVKDIFRDNITFSPAIALEKITPVSEDAQAVLQKYGYGLSRTLVNEDEPEHLPRRRALMEPFTPAALEHHEPFVRKLVRQYVDRFIERGNADLVDDLLWDVPCIVALVFLGVPEEDIDRMRRYSVAHTVSTWGRPTGSQQVAVAEAVGKFWVLAGEILDKLRADPSGTGWMPYAIRKQKELPDVVTDSYLHSIMMAGIVAAHETTANGAAGAFRVLLENRESWDEICADPSLISNAVEESLRHSGSVAAWRRIATKATTIGGVELPKGAKLLIVNSSANHDPRQFDSPDSFDIHRINASDHLTFGYGSHQCMGKNLARMEIQIFLEEITTRIPHLHISDQEFSYLPNTSFRGPEHVRVYWDPSKNPERTDPSVLDRRLKVKIGEPSKPKTSVPFPMVVASSETVADGVVKLRLVAKDHTRLPMWSPGAHIDLVFRDFSRQYSLCGDPADRHGFEIAVLLEAESRGGSKYIHEHLVSEGNIKVRGPRNHFKLAAANRYIFIAGGIGITPILPMLNDAKRRGVDYEIHYCGRSESTMAFLPRLRESHGESLFVYARDRGQRLSLHELLKDCEQDTVVYSCGPQRMLDGISTATDGWPPERVHVEHFVAANTELAAENEHEFDVELKDIGLTVTVPRDKTILQVLRANNIDIQSDCEEGLCGSCEAPVLEGDVDHRDMVLSPQEKASNKRMMVCCSRATGKKLTLDL